MLTLGLLTAFDPCSARADPAARPSVSLTLPVRRRSLPNGPDQGSQNFHSAGPPPFSVASKSTKSEVVWGTHFRPLFGGGRRCLPRETTHLPQSHRVI